MEDGQLTAKQIYEQYKKGVSYNEGIDLYETVNKNENFFIGRQWEGVTAPDLDKPVFNILKRVTNLFISMIVSDDITASLKPYGENEESEKICRIAEKEVQRSFEYANLKQKNREVLKNACIDGDGCLYFYFDEAAKTGQVSEGFINANVVDNTNIIFANTASADVQKQPYVIIIARKPLSEVKRLAGRYGMTEAEIENIKCESAEENFFGSDTADEAVSVFYRFHKENGRVFASVSTKEQFLKEPFDTGLTLYPVAYFNWERVKNSYHGQAPVTELIPNQIFINKCYAMGMDYVKKLAFPKLIYDINRLPNGFSNKIGEAICVEGGINDAVASAFKMPEMSNQIMELVEKTMQYTKEYMGASDATLGNLRPDNASAIISVQKATNAPLELVKLSFYKAVEDCVRIILDMAAAYYGVRYVDYAKDGAGGLKEAFDFEKIREIEYNLEVNIGASTYWSEIMQVQTADNLFTKGIITDPLVYLNSIPDGYIRNKQKIIRSIEERRERGDLESEMI